MRSSFFEWWVMFASLCFFLRQKFLQLRWVKLCSYYLGKNNCSIQWNSLRQMWRKFALAISPIPPVSPDFGHCLFFYQAELASSIAPRAAFSLWTMSCSMLWCLVQAGIGVNAKAGCWCDKLVKLSSGLLTSTPFFLDYFMYISMAILGHNEREMDTAK